jgi:formylmethanofuran dehydrogenase subunit E
MPAQELLVAEGVQLTLDVEQIISTPGLRVNCDRCGEEIMNAREVRRNGAILCRHCNGDIYFRSIPDALPVRTAEELELGTSNGSGRL